MLHTVWLWLRQRMATKSWNRMRSINRIYLIKFMALNLKAPKALKIESSMWSINAIDLIPVVSVSVRGIAYSGLHLQITLNMIMPFHSLSIHIQREGLRGQAREHMRAKDIWFFLSYCVMCTHAIYTHIFRTASGCRSSSASQHTHTNAHTHTHTQLRAAAAPVASAT